VLRISQSVRVPCRCFAEIFRSTVRTRPRHAVHTAKTPSVRQPQRNRGLLSPIAYYRNYRPTAGIDPIVLRAVLISWNDIRIPVRPDDRDPNVNTNGFDRSRLPFGSRRQGRRRKGQYNNKRSEQAVGALHDSSPDGPMHSLRVTGVCRKGASWTGHGIVSSSPVAGTACLR